MEKGESVILDEFKLTDRQKQVLTFMVNYTVQNLHTPTIREMGEVFGGMSPNGVMGHIRALAKKGFLEQRKKQDVWRVKGLVLEPKYQDSEAGHRLAAIMGVNNEQ